ncbi:MAG: transcriptional regulator NrdR [Candidatus Aureabacteria bacterium]|nr:transcriptional regulator NrdR [Candidatus Auribacterota bacterium]
MKCPFCGHLNDRVIDSRLSPEGDKIRRRRECIKCDSRFTTYEKTEEVPVKVIKKDKSRENFDRVKLFGGISRACEKRPVSTEQIEEIVTEIEKYINRNALKEIQSDVIGEMVIKKLQKIDEVAYVRFASVYRQFKDINQFMSELQLLLNQSKKEK